MSNDLCMRCYISGRVQGVSYRASAQKMAKQLMITGWAKNLLDGRVEVFACGKEDKLDEFYIWLQQGPLNARVDVCTRENLPWEDYITFDVL
ncbi:TPA: acylphosphatase [Legionella pneumophila]|uniref:acylphosphatase n=1 Tax=Legionella pneumophila TaxID=446 RepID=A0A2S6EYP3_LEGPN|nr:acylphosphatase [Legionella pneumophila]APF03502.1 acylphosphatase [Legionella pneumophila subsp. fraseri]APF06532.1 acylphosphatase [Legionella pneumophila subsp. fraseri]AUB68987.1 acylphosphatase [Legionella pneumophila]AUB71960.1 acylphosphatase [Legionella pneumophila]KXB26304.1 acylphosphatase [Legionella pneumophila]